MRLRLLSCLSYHFVCL